MTAMTDDTKNALEQAAQDLVSARAEADREKRACLAQIAAGLPEKAAEAAKYVATEQPVVTKALGKDGVAKMRSVLQTAAEELGQRFVAAEDEIDWPLGSAYSKVENRNVHSALFNRFYKKTGTLSEVLTANGYKLGNSDPFIPQALYTESEFTSLAAALTALGKATERFKEARKADDDATVDDLWGD